MGGGAVLTGIGGASWKFGLSQPLSPIIIPARTTLRITTASREANGSRLAANGSCAMLLPLEILIVTL